MNIPRVLLLQLPVPSNPAANVPLAAGYLKAYARAAGLLDRVAIEIMPRDLADTAGDAMLVDAIVARAPDLLGLSLYTWNSERSLDIARRVKERLPDLLVVAGGPECQPDNDWVLRHPALDIAVIGEGEQTFAEILRRWSADGARWTMGGESPGADRLSSIDGIAFRSPAGDVVLTPERAALPDLSVVPSPYLLGYLEVERGGMLMVEVSRWCPYACSFCLYGRNMGPKLGGRYFPLARLLDEIRWGRERGAASVHFVEANLNLVPVFQPLMRALADLNADGGLALYAELRGEHLGEESVAALARAGLRVAEVGLQSANPAALRAAQRRTDLAKWAAGTRRLYAHGVEVLLDVILGLPADDAAGVAETLDFIRRERLGPYDAFTLQVLPGTAVRRQAEAYGLRFQERPPYYVLATDRMPYAELRRLRRELKRGAGLDPDAVEGCPPPRLDALARDGRRPMADGRRPLDHITLLDCDSDWMTTHLAQHAEIVGRWSDLGARQAAPARGRWSRWLADAIAANPSALIDLYLLCDEPPEPAELRAWRDGLPYQPGYLDRVAVYRRAAPAPEHDRVSPRLWLVLPWSAQADPQAYAGVAEVIWAYDIAPGEEPPLAAWEAAGGAGVWARGAAPQEVERWRAQTAALLWG